MAREYPGIYRYEHVVSSNGHGKLEHAGSAPGADALSGSVQGGNPAWAQPSPRSAPRVLSGS